METPGTHGDSQARRSKAEGVRGRPDQRFGGVRGKGTQGQGSRWGLPGQSECPGGPRAEAGCHLSRHHLSRHAGQGDSGLVLRAGWGGGLACGLGEGVDDFGRQRGPVTPEGEQLQTRALGELGAVQVSLPCGDCDLPRPRVRTRVPLPHVWLPASWLQTGPTTSACSPSGRRVWHRDASGWLCPWPGRVRRLSCCLGFGCTVRTEGQLRWARKPCTSRWDPAQTVGCGPGTRACPGGQWHFGRAVTLM